MSVPAEQRMCLKRALHLYLQQVHVLWHALYLCERGCATALTTLYYR